MSFVKYIVCPFIAFVLLLLAVLIFTSPYGLSDTRPRGDETVCLEMHLVNGLLDTACYVVPIRRSAFQINENKGSYYLAYVHDDWYDCHWRTLRNGVIKFKELTNSK